MSDITQHAFKIKHIFRVNKMQLPNQHMPFGTPRMYACFIYVLSGSGLFTMDDGRQYEACEGNIVFISKGYDYSLDISDHFHYIRCDFCFAANIYRQSALIRPKNPPNFERLFRSLAGTYAVDSPFRKPECLSLLYHIYACIIQDSQTQYISGSSRARIETARIWCQTHLDDPELSVKKLASIANMSKGYFRELFQNLYGTPPVKYIMQERIMCAKKLMEMPELRLEDIAAQAGFSSLAYFHKVFKDFTGTTPGLYRQKLLEQQ